MTAGQLKRYERQLKKYADKFLMENYGMTLTVPLKLNGRLSKTLGWFSYTRKEGRPLAVEINKKFAINNDAELVLDVLKHELVHYALFMQGKPHSDGDSYFENELQRKGIVSQTTINKKYKIASVKNVYKCKSCDFTHHKARRLVGLSRYSCACGGNLEYLGKRVVTA
ncbi:hypothetical protein X915_gp089 [Bacillus phage vB_BanS-Tsamsa]|uniref:SprT-like domain-containing protein n=1 Tax=Bacillus phage vB_BanS-Tsamsa TaxID=1308863 RepID=U5J9G1_9CAUD|nr:hypothetical protein X915_gp089 [Bacillus phage vB_BanS-Tsamsa]AGI11813.1 hypothetical protein [Bacillus phage vB_BanS-Tsamsa]